MPLWNGAPDPTEIAVPGVMTCTEIIEKHVHNKRHFLIRLLHGYCRSMPWPGIRSRHDSAALGGGVGCLRGTRGL